MKGFWTLVVAAALLSPVASAQDPDIAARLRAAASAVDAQRFRAKRSDSV